MKIDSASSLLNSCDFTIDIADRQYLFASDNISHSSYLWRVLEKGGHAKVRRVDGSKIAQLRKLRGWGQYELAQAANIAPSVVSRLERNLQADYKLSVIDAVALALNVSIDALLISQETIVDVDLSSELQMLLGQVRNRPLYIQHQIAGMIRGYLIALDDNE